MAKSADVSKPAAKKAETKNEVATQKPGGAIAVAEAMPDFMRGQAGRGVEALSSTDFETPRIKLLQALSPEIEEFEDARAGCFWHSTLNLNLGKSLIFSPIYIDKRYILWRPRPEGGILARADDGVNWSPANASFDVVLEKSKKAVTWRTRPTVVQSGLAEWGSSDPSDPSSQPAATLMYNMYLVPMDEGVPPGVFTMQRSMVKNAKKFLGKLRMAGAPSYGCVYLMESYLDDNTAGQKYHNVRFTANGYVPDQAAFDRHREMYEGLKKEGLKITDLETLHPDAAEAGDTIDADPDAPAY